MPKALTPQSCSSWREPPPPPPPPPLPPRHPHYQPSASQPCLSWDAPPPPLQGLRQHSDFHCKGRYDEIRSKEIRADEEEFHLYAWLLRFLPRNKRCVFLFAWGIGLGLDSFGGRNLLLRMIWLGLFIWSSFYFRLVLFGIACPTLVLLFPDT